MKRKFKKTEHPSRQRTIKRANLPPRYPVSSARTAQVGIGATFVASRPTFVVCIPTFSPLSRKATTPYQ